MGEKEARAGGLHLELSWLESPEVLTERMLSLQLIELLGGVMKKNLGKTLDSQENALEGHWGPQLRPLTLWLLRYQEVSSML